MLRVASIVDETEAEGPGHRFAVWVQGCSLRCAGCCNPEMFDERRGEPMAIESLAARIPATVEGITLLGGEPFEQAAGLAELARRAHASGLTVMVFSGFTLEETVSVAWNFTSVLGIFPVLLIRESTSWPI